jgi:hypothetical protein
MSEPEKILKTQVEVEGIESLPSMHSESVLSQMKDLQEFLISGGVAEVQTNQLYSSDPFAFLPLNTAHLVGVTNVIQSIFTEADLLIEEELKEVSRPQKQISIWEERIRKNNGIINQNGDQIKQNIADMACDLKGRDFWCSRASQVLADYGQTETTGSASDWAWLIKKYGLKNEEGSLICHRTSGLNQLCQKAAQILSAEYSAAAVRYELTHQHKESSNALLLSDNEKLSAMNSQLQKYIANLYSSEVEPLQDGVLLLKELVVKLKALETQESPATYGDLRSWAEPFLDQFLRGNSSIPNRVVTAFRRLCSIPLPAQNS